MRHRGGAPSASLTQSCGGSSDGIAGQLTSSFQQMSSFGIAGRQGQRPIERSAGRFERTGTAVEFTSRRPQEVIVVEAREPVEVGESGKRTFSLGNGHCVIECDHR